IRDRNVTGVQTCALPISPGGNHPGTHRDRRWGGCPRGIGSRRLTGESREKETMTATATETSPAQGTALGRISRVIGPVVDIEFPLDSVPEIYNALTTTVDLSEGTRKLSFEVGLHLGNGLVRAVSLPPTDGLVRCQEVVDSGAPISVPVGDVTKHHVWNTTGDCLNLAEGEELEISERWPIHRPAPAFDELESKTEILEVG